MAKKKEAAPEKVVITDRMALEALANLAGWPADDPDISKLSDEAVLAELNDNIDVIREKEDKKTVLAMENGAEIWDFFLARKKELAQATVGKEAGKGEAEKKAKATKEPKEPKPPKEPPAPKYLREQSVIDTLKEKKSGTVKDLIQASDDLYAANGGKASPSMAEWTGKVVFKTLTVLGLLQEKDGTITYTGK